MITTTGMHRTAIHLRGCLWNGWGHVYRHRAIVTDTRRSINQRAFITRQGAGQFVSVIGGCGACVCHACLSVCAHLCNGSNLPFISLREGETESYDFLCGLMESLLIGFRGHIELTLKYEACQFGWCFFLMGALLCVYAPGFLCPNVFWCDWLCGRPGERWYNVVQAAKNNQTWCPVISGMAKITDLNSCFHQKDVALHCDVCWSILPFYHP